jgi:hypothetical protein
MTTKATTAPFLLAVGLLVLLSSAFLPAAGQQGQHQTAADNPRL